MTTDTQKKTVTLICKECGCRKEMPSVMRGKPGKEVRCTEVPVGECEFCSKENAFGWAMFPECFDNMTGREIIQEGDVVTISPKEPLGSRHRIFSIERDGKFIYAENA